MSVGDNILPESWNFDARLPYSNIEQRSLDDNVLGKERRCLWTFFFLTKSRSCEGENQKIFHFDEPENILMQRFCCW